MKKYIKLLENDFVKKNADINCLVGEYIVIGNPHIKSFELKKEHIIQIRPMNIKNGHLAGQSPAFCRPINIHRPAANEHFKCSLV